MTDKEMAKFYGISEHALKFIINMPSIRKAISSKGIDSETTCLYGMRDVRPTFETTLTYYTGDDWISWKAFKNLFKNTKTSITISYTAKGWDEMEVMNDAMKGIISQINLYNEGKIKIFKTKE